jgi:RNA polymerase sigma factor (sigma-70 family)
VDTTTPTVQLVAAANCGDASAWDALVERYSRLVWAVARSFRLSSADAADVSQTTWLRLVEKLDTIKDPDHLAGWLATTAKRESLRILRLSGRESPTFDDGEELLGPEAGSLEQNPEALALLGDEYTHLWRAFARLSESCQVLLWLVTVAPLGSYAEVSAALGMPIGSIGPTRSRCLDRLRAQLS